MARPWRIQFPQAIYHITSRGNNRQAIFLDDRDRFDFLGCLATASARFGLEIFAFCLMSNHYHLFLRTPRGNLSQTMHWFNATFTSRFNRRHRRSGHLFQGRYHTVLVANEAHWQELSMYLHLNPVRAGIVDDPAEFEWSSFRDYTGRQSRFPWLCPGEILSLYGEGPSARRRYRQDCLALAGRKPDFEEQVRNGILGGQEIIEQLLRQHPPKGQKRTVSDYARASRLPVEAMAELRRVAQTFGVEVKDLMRKRRNFPPRLAAFHHLVSGCGLRVSAVAELMGVSATAVTLGARQFRILLDQDQRLRQRISQLTCN